MLNSIFMQTDIKTAIDEFRVHDELVGRNTELEFETPEVKCP